MLKKLFLILPAFFLVIILTAQTSNNTFLWRIDNPANPQPSYLFGTLHLPQERFMALTDSVYDAINKTECFYSEIDFQNMQNEMEEDQDFFVKKMAYLDSVKHTARWKSLIGALNRKYNETLDPDSLEQFSNFGQKVLGDIMKPEKGVTAMDMAMANYATTLGKTTKGLERFSTQLGMIYDVLDLKIKDTTLLFNEDITINKSLEQFYATQKFDSLASVINNLNPEYRKIFFDNRNFKMADSMASISANKSAFFAVGSGHLVGEKGIIALLKAKKLQLTPIFSTNRFSITLMEKIFKKGIEHVKDELKKDVTDDGVVAPPKPPRPPRVPKPYHKISVKKASIKSQKK